MPVYFVHLPHGRLRGRLAGLDAATDGEPVGRRRPGEIVTEQEQHLSIAVDRQDTDRSSLHGCHTVSLPLPRLA